MRIGAAKPLHVSEMSWVGLLLYVYSLDTWVSAFDCILQVSSDLVRLFHTHLRVKVAVSHYVSTSSNPTNPYSVNSLDLVEAPCYVLDEPSEFPIIFPEFL